MLHTIIHQTHPCHLVTGFQLLGRASGLHHLREYPVHPLLGGIVNVQQVGGEFSAASQLPPQVMLVLLQVAAPQTAILAGCPDRLCRFGV